MCLKQEECFIRFPNTEKKVEKTKRRNRNGDEELRFSSFHKNQYFQITTRPGTHGHL